MLKQQKQALVNNLRLDFTKSKHREFWQAQTSNDDGVEQHDVKVPEQIKTIVEGIEEMKEDETFPAFKAFIVEKANPKRKHTSILSRFSFFSNKKPAIPSKALEALMTCDMKDIEKLRMEEYVDEPSKGYYCK